VLSFDASVLPEEADGALLHFDSAMMPRSLQNEKQAEIWLEDMVKNCTIMQIKYCYLTASTV